MTDSVAVLDDKSFPIANFPMCVSEKLLFSRSKTSFLRPEGLRKAPWKGKLEIEEPKGLKAEKRELLNEIYVFLRNIESD